MSVIYSNKNLVIDYIQWKPPFGSDARRSLQIKNAGGDSDLSEALSIHHLSTIFNAEKVTLEKEITYYYTSKMVDYILHLPSKDEEGINIGVSVTRCFGNSLISEENLINFLKKKITGLIVSYNSVSEEQSFDSTILHIFVPSEEIKTKLLSLINSDKIDLEELQVSRELTMWITHSPDDFIFKSKKALGFGFKEELLKKM